VRESADVKGRRYLAEGRLTILHVSDSAIAATCRGNGAVYRPGWSTVAAWACDCPARGVCAHLVALQLVTVREVA